MSQSQKTQNQKDRLKFQKKKINDQAKVIKEQAEMIFNLSEKKWKKTFTFQKDCVIIYIYSIIN